MSDFRIAQIVLSDASFSHRPDFLSLETTTKVPTGPLELSLECEVSAPDRVAIVRLRASNDSAPADASLYRFNLCLLAMLELSSESGLGEGDEKVLAITAASMLFPFLRETLASLTSRGRFGPIWLQPVNVRQLIADNAQKPVANENSPADAPAPKRVARRKSK